MSDKILVFFLISCLISCKNSTNNSTAHNENIGIPIYFDSKNYDNNLSTIASEIEFIPIDSNPLFNDFHILSIEICDQYFFISASNFIYQYEKNGHFIKAIGKRGSGPEEFINLFTPLSLDQDNKLIYAHDTNRNRVIVYGYDGTFKKVFPVPMSVTIQLINSDIIAFRQSLSDRRRSESPMIEFIDTTGKSLHRYPSRYYPIPKEKMENLGPDTSPLWKYKDHFHYLEYGTDTIFCISETSLQPLHALTGELKLSVEEHYHNNIGKKLRIITPISRYNSGVFESNEFIIFRLSSNYECFFMIYNKNTGLLHRTFYENAPQIFRGPNKRERPKEHDYFIDDMISGLSYNPLYQSDGKAIALIPASMICEKKDEILDFIDKHPSEKGTKLRPIIQNMNEDDNSLMMIATFK